VEQQQAPAAWLHSIIQYFHNSSAKDHMSKYRGITMLDMVIKLFHKVLANRLVSHAEALGLLPRMPSGGAGPAASTSTASARWPRAGSACACQPTPFSGPQESARKAYVTAWRARWPDCKLWDMGIRGRMWRYVDALYAWSMRVVRRVGLLACGGGPGRGPG
jgi:hypothetical protein